MLVIRMGSNGADSVRGEYLVLVFGLTEKLLKESMLVLHRNY